MEDNKILKFIYIFFLGLLLAVFVGVGVSTFYEPPKMPEYPISEVYEEKPTAEQMQRQREYDKRFEAYNKELKPYNRNVSLITLTAAVAFVIASLVFSHRMKIIADGVMLGGLFTLLYSVGRSFEADDKKYTFAVVSVGLLLVIYLGYHRFIRQSKTSG